MYRQGAQIRRRVIGVIVSPHSFSPDETVKKLRTVLPLSDVAVVEANDAEKQQEERDSEKQERVTDVDVLVE